MTRLNQVFSHLARDRKISTKSSLYFNLQNISEYGEGRVLRAASHIFPCHQIHICTQNTPRIGGKEYAKILNTSGMFVSPIIRCSIEGVYTTALVDTGAQVSIIDAEFPRKIAAPIGPPTMAGIVGVSGTELQVLGTIKTEIKFQRQGILIELQVIEKGDSDPPIIIGTDTMILNHFLIDFRDLSVKVNGSLVSTDKPICDIFRQTRSEYLKTSRDIKLPARTTVPVKLRVKWDETAFTIDYLNPRIKYLNLVCPQHATEALAEVEKEFVIINLRNHSRKMVKIFAGTRLAHIALYKKVQRDKKEARINSIRGNQQEEENALWDQIKEKIVDQSDL